MLCDIADCAGPKSALCIKRFVVHGEDQDKLPADGWSDQGVTGCFGTFFGSAYNDWSQLGAEVVGTCTNLVFVTLPDARDRRRFILRESRGFFGAIKRSENTSKNFSFLR